MECGMFELFRVHIKTTVDFSKQYSLLFIACNEGETTTLEALTTTQPDIEG